MVKNSDGNAMPFLGVWQLKRQNTTKHVVIMV